LRVNRKKVISPENGLPRIARGVQTSPHFVEAVHHPQYWGGTHNNRGEEYKKPEEDIISGSNLLVQEEERGRE